MIKLKSFVLIITLVSCSTKSEELLKTLVGSSMLFSEINRFTRSAMKTHQVSGLGIAVVNGGTVVYSQTFGVSSPESREKLGKDAIFESASPSKPVFAYFVRKQVEKGIMHLDDNTKKRLQHV